MGRGLGKRHTCRAVGLGVSGTPRRKPDRGGACCRTGGAAGSIPDAFCCGATVGDDKAQGRGRRVPPDHGQGHRSEKVEAQGGLGESLRLRTGGLSLRASLITESG